MKKLIAMMFIVVAVSCLMASTVTAYQSNAKVSDRIGLEVIEVEIQEGDLSGVFGAVKWVFAQPELKPEISFAEAFVKTCLLNFDTPEACEEESKKLRVGDILRVMVPVLPRAQYTEKVIEPFKNEIETLRTDLANEVEKSARLEALTLQKPKVVEITRTIEVRDPSEGIALENILKSNAFRSDEFYDGFLDNFLFSQYWPNGKYDSYLIIGLAVALSTLLLAFGDWISSLADKVGLERLNHFGIKPSEELKNLLRKKDREIDQLRALLLVETSENKNLKAARVAKDDGNVSFNFVDKEIGEFTAHYEKKATYRCLHENCKASNVTHLFEHWLGHLRMERDQQKEVVYLREAVG